MDSAIYGRQALITHRSIDFPGLVGMANRGGLEVLYRGFRPSSQQVAI